VIRADHEFPQITKHRGTRDPAHRYFGPFASAGAVNRTLNALQKAFLLRSCSDSVFSNRTRPCLLHQIRRCSAPCVGLIRPADYQHLVDEAEGFLAGKSRQVQDELAREMQAAAEDLAFERAAALRDRIRALSQVQSHQDINPDGVQEADVIAIHQAGGQSCVQVFFIRAGQNWGNRAFFPRHDKSFGTADVLSAFLGQFYDDKVPPTLVLLSEKPDDMALLAEALSVRAGRRVQLHVPQRGEKQGLVTHALTNAKDALGRRMAESAGQRALLEKLGDAFDMEAPPRRVEVYDNSHPAAQVSADPVPDTDTATWPDLVLIDGGKGQLAIAEQVLTELGIDGVTLVGIAKGPDRNAGRERFFMPGRPDFSMEPNSPVLYFLQRLRDEAHRFAIGSHRAKRTRAISASPLDEIDGIGAARKRALLHHFGSAKAVSGAGIEDLAAVSGISRAVAKKIWDHFNAG
jgi:excinuclease ABC subunit C